MLAGPTQTCGGSRRARNWTKLFGYTDAAGRTAPYDDFTGRGGAPHIVDPMMNVCCTWRRRREGGCIVTGQAEGD